MSTRSFAATHVARYAAGQQAPARRASATPFAPGGALPRVWVLSSPRAGERSQLLALAEALGCPFEVKQIVHRRIGAVVSLVGGETLAGVDRARSDVLEGPWPDLVLLAHQSNENVARWIRRQSGGRTRLVLIGRPWAPIEAFDLVVTTPQYDLPEAANVLHNPLPLHQVAPERLAAAAAKWQPRLAHLPRPFVTVLVGGSSGPYVFDAAAAERLGREVSALARGLGGSVLVTTSARTPIAAVDALFAAIDAPACLHRWAPGDSQNPYFGFVALADRIVVTADSISMIAEACATGRPVQMFDFGAGALPMREEDEAVAGGPGPSLAARLRGWLYAAYSRLPLGRLNRSRDLRVVHRALLATGRVSWLGDRLPSGGVRIVGDEMTRTLNRLRGLLNVTGRRTSPTSAEVDGPELAAASA
jgi:mitochondrial fission protein ELM1